MKINVNIPCTVTLTKDGADIINNYMEELYAWSKNKPDKVYKENDTYESPLWEIMHIFGKSLYMGTYKLPFFENIIDLYDTEIKQILDNEKAYKR